MDDTAHKLRELTGAHTRIVRSQQQAGFTDMAMIQPDFKLMGLDTDDGKGVHAILDEVASYCTPVFRNTVIAFNIDGQAVFCNEEGYASLSCCDVYGNTGGDWVGCIAEQYGTENNISADPLFCNPAAGDFTLAADSPCLDAFGCGLLGPLGPGCGSSTGVDERHAMPSTWGLVKGLFRVPGGQGSTAK